MKILFTAEGIEWNSPVDPRFGRSKFFFIYNEETKTIETYDNRAIADEAHGAGPKTAQKMAEYKVDIVITGNGPGGNAATVIQQLGTKVYAGAGDMTIKEAYDAYKKDDLKRC